MACSRSLTFFATTVVSLAMLVAVAGCAGIASNHQPTELTRRQAAGQFVCHEEDITVRELGNAEVQATGCGKTATWSCSGNADGHSTEELLDRRCQRITEIGSEWGNHAPIKAPRAAKSEETTNGNSTKSAPTAPTDNATSGASNANAPFPREDVRTALQAAKGGLHSCKSGDNGKTAALEATLRFEPTGKVSKVEVTPASGASSSPVIEGALTSCVRSRLSEVAITPFSGEPVTVKMPIHL